jgi:Protein of unknown function (DUF4089)
MKTRRAKSLSKRKTRRSRPQATKRPAKPPRVDPLDALVDASARALALPLDPAWHPAIKTNLEVILRQAALFADFPLPDDAEPAPVFVA